MAEEVVVTGYEVGKELGLFTPQLLGAGMAFGVSVLMLLPVGSTVHAAVTGASPTYFAAAFTAFAVSLSLGILATIAHRRSPKSKATVIRTVKNCNGLYSAELRLLDGSTVEHNLGLALPLNKQFVGFTKSLLTGK